MSLRRHSHVCNCRGKAIIEKMNTYGSQSNALTIIVRSRDGFLTVRCNYRHRTSELSG
jgi:hypothetical protein